MANLPAMMFYTGDWMRDPAVRSVSLAARGLWFDMLCLAHNSPRRGYLEHATGRPVTEEQIARMTGATPEEAAGLLEELMDAGVCSRTQDGVYYSRRMARDALISASRAAAGSKGGSKRASKYPSKTSSEDASNALSKTPTDRPTGSNRAARSQANAQANHQAKGQQKQPLSVSSSVSVSPPLKREGSVDSPQAREATVVPALPDRDSGGGCNARTRNPADPPQGVSADDWRRACGLADAIETEELSPRAVEAGGVRRAHAIALEVERRGGDWEDAERIVMGILACQERDQRLGRLLSDLRRYPDGILASTGRDGRGPCRLDFARRILVQLGSYRADTPLAADRGLTPLPPVRL